MPDKTTRLQKSIKPAKRRSDKAGERSIPPHAPLMDRRRSLGYTREHIIEVLGISKSTAIEWEIGYREISAPLSTIAKLMQLYDLSFEELRQMNLETIRSKNLEMMNDPCSNRRLVIDNILRSIEHCGDDGKGINQSNIIDIPSNEITNLSNHLDIRLTYFTYLENKGFAVNKELSNKELESLYTHHRRKNTMIDYLVSKYGLKRESLEKEAIANLEIIKKEQERK